MWPKEEDYIRSSLSCLRHMPPGTLETDPSESNSLLRELLSLPDAIDPVSWIAEHHSKLAARIAVWSVLRFTGHTLLGIKRATAAGISIESLDMYTALAQSVPVSEVLLGLDARSHSIPDSDSLQAIVSNLRAVAGGLVDPRMIPSGWPLITVLLGKLFTGEELDIIRSLSTENAKEIAVLALRHLIEISLFHPGAIEDLGSVGRRVSPRESFHFAGIRLKFNEVALAERGTLFRIEAVLSRPALEAAGFPKGTSTVEVRWAGFDHVVDDHGFCHLVRILRSESRRRAIGGWALHQTAVAYPAPGSMPKMLRFEQPEGRFELIGGETRGPPITTHAVSTGPISIEIRF